MRAFLNLLYRELPGQESYLTLTAIHPDKAHPAPSRHIRLDDGAGLEDALTRLSRMQDLGYGAFFGVATRRADLGRWTRGGRADLALLPALFADVDKPDVNLERFPLPPTLTVSSGRGLHLYWMLAQPTHDFTRAETIMRGLARVLNGDSMTAPQALRLPGSLNTKYTPARRCELLEAEPHRLYQLADFEELLQPPPPAPRRVQTAALRGDWLETRKQDIAHILLNEYQGVMKPNGWIASLCPCGHEKDSPGRHFNYHPGIGVARCFGKHGKMLVKDLWGVLGARR